MEWDQGQGAYKRAWIQHRTGERDWTGTSRYLNVVRCGKPGRLGGNPTDFPIYNDLPDEQILLAFVYATNTVTGLPAIERCGPLAPQTDHKEWERET